MLGTFFYLARFALIWAFTANVSLNNEDDHCSLYHSHENVTDCFFPCTSITLCLKIIFGVKSFTITTSEILNASRG